MAQKFTYVQKMLNEAEQLKKFNKIYVQKRKNCLDPSNDNIVWAQPIPLPHLTYYNNGKRNLCCKGPYEYNHFYCEGYDQRLKKYNQKHPHFYLNNDIEEEYPCHTIPITINSTYGHRPTLDSYSSCATSVDSSCENGKQSIETVRRRTNGVKHAMTGNEEHSVKLNPTLAFKYNQTYGYTYTPPT